MPRSVSPLGGLEAFEPNLSINVYGGTVTINVYHRYHVHYGHGPAVNNGVDTATHTCPSVALIANGNTITATPT
jgi:hypothetical protein